MGLLQGDQVMRFALPPPPGAIAAAPQPATTADPAVVASRPAAALSPDAATPIILPVPEAAPRSQAVRATDETVSSAAEQSADAAAPRSPQPDADDAHSDPGSRTAPARTPSTPVEIQPSSEAVSDVKHASFVDVQGMSANDADGSDKAAPALQAPPVQSSLMEPAAQASKDATASIRSQTADYSPVTAAGGEASAERHVLQAPSVPRMEPELAAVFSTPHTAPSADAFAQIPDRSSGEPLTGAAITWNQNQTAVQSYEDARGGAAMPLGTAVSSPQRSARSELSSAQLLPSAKDIRHAHVRDASSEQPQKAEKQVDYGPLGPLG